MSTSRRTAEQWAQWIDRQRRSGTSVAGFCARHGLAVSSFHRWRRRLAAVEASTFVEVATAMPTGDSVVIELLLPNGVVAQVRSGFDAALLRQVVEALR